MLLRIIYDALDQNSHFKLFQLVSRRGFGLAGDLDDRADRPQAVHRDKLALCILPNPAHRGDCVGVGVFVARKVFVKFFYVLIPKDRNGIRPDAIDLLNRWVGFCVAAKLRHVIPLFIRLVLAYYPNILLPAGNDRLCGRGHFMRGFDPRVRCRFHPRLTIFIIGEVERDGLRGRGVLHLPDQIAGLLHEPCRPDSHRADISARAIACDLADRMLWGGRESERILYRIMLSVFRNADNIYNNAGHVVFRGLGGLVGGRGVRLPNGVESGGRGGCCNPITRLDGGRCCVRFPIPAEEVVAFSGRNRAGNGERHRAGAALLRHRVGAWHVGDEIRRVGVVGQGVGDFGVRVLRDQIDRRALVAGRIPTLVERPNRRVRICFLAPANDLIATVHSCSVRSRLDVADGDRVVVVGRVAVRRRILAYKLRLFRCAVIVADTELIADIENGERYIDLVAGIQRLRTDTVVSRKG